MVYFRQLMSLNKIQKIFATNQTIIINNFCKIAYLLHCTRSIMTVLHLIMGTRLVKITFISGLIHLT